MQISYKTREVSTADFLDDFDPPLVFLMKRRTIPGWLDMIDEIAEIVSVPLAKNIMSGICYAVVDAEGERATIDEFYEGLQGAAPEMADQLFCDLAYALGIEFLRDAKRRINALKKTRAPSNGIAADPTPASELSEAS